MLDTIYKAPYSIQCCNFLDDQNIILGYNSIIDIFNINLELSVY